MKALELLYQYQQADEIAGGYMNKPINEAIKELEVLTTSKQTTQSKFKVGDWVRYIKGKTKKTAKVIVTDQIKNYVGISTGENVPIEECELWKPSKSEWVWINTRADSLPFIACLLTQIKVDSTLVFTDYSYTEKGKRQDVLIHPNELISLEPFIGELPSFITK